MTPRDLIAFGGLIIALCGFVVSVIWLVFHTRIDAETRRKVKRLEKKIREHKCQGSEE